MKIYFAPLEGITGFIFRNAYNDIFESKIDKYFSPFIAPGINQVLSRKEMRDILPENNCGISLVPQLLGCRPTEMLMAIEQIKDLGYDEININLGCPSGTVVAKKKGSGFLAYPDELDKFLYEIYEKADVKISVKTRIGKDNPEEFYRLLEIYNKYQMSELIIHPRVQKDFYKNTPNMEIFDYAVKNSRNRLCYNGNIVFKRDYEELESKYKECNVESVMIGRGLLRNYMLVDEIKDGRETDRGKLIEFHNRIKADYVNEMSGERPVLFKMKELWTYMGDLFDDCDKQLKALRKSNKLSEYEIYANMILKNAALK